MVPKHQNSMDLESGHFLPTGNSDEMPRIWVQDREFLLPLRKDAPKHGGLRRSRRSHSWLPWMPKHTFITQTLASSIPEKSNSPSVRNLTHTLRTQQTGKDQELCLPSFSLLLKYAQWNLSNYISWRPWEWPSQKHQIHSPAGRRILLARRAISPKVDRLTWCSCPKQTIQAQQAQHEKSIGSKNEEVIVKIIELEHFRFVHKSRRRTGSGYCCWRECL